MKAPVTTFNLWILNKIANFLASKEGCEIETINYTLDGVRAVVKDSFGYRYEVHVETLSRVHDGAPDEWQQRLSFQPIHKA